MFTGQEGSRSLSDVGTDFTRDSNIPGTVSVTLIELILIIFFWFSFFYLS